MDGVELGGAGDPESDGLGDSDGVGSPDWGEGEADSGDGEPEDGGGEPEEGDGDPEGGGEADGGGVMVCSTGGGGACGGWLRKIKIAISTASAAMSSISNQEMKMVHQPARS